MTQSPLLPTGPARFAEEVARVRESGAIGDGGRLRELFDYLAERGESAAPASQAEIAEDVFGQADSDGDDATARVYVHRLRKRLDQFYEAQGTDGPEARLTVPPGTYALRLITAGGPASSPERRRMLLTWALVAALVLVTALAFAAGRFTGDSGSEPSINAVWQPFIDSERPIMVVVGDYYMFGEIDPLSPERGRLIRDFRVDSPTDLARAQAEEPERYGRAEDVGLTYLPLSAADALAALMPILSHDDKPVRVVPASELTSQTLSNFNVVYVGLLSGMGLLEDVNFMDSNFVIGESYDELIHLPSDGHFVSTEAQMLPLPGYYTDYGYLSVFREPGGGLVAIVAGARDTGLRAVAPLVARATLPPQLAEEASSGDRPAFEALFEITGQQGADLNERLVLAGKRPQS